jgi:AP-1-like factor
MIGKLPGTSSDGDADTHDKRSHPDDDGEEEEGGGKRREGDEKTGKKPGRKPLTSEPTSVSPFEACILIPVQPLKLSTEA